MTLHDYEYLPPEFLRSYPGFGVKFSNIHSVSESSFLPGFFQGEGNLLLCKFLLL